MASEREQTASLLQMSEEAVIRSVAESVKGISATFSCGGSIPLQSDDNIRLHFQKVKNDTTTLHAVRFPHVNNQEEDMEHLTSACEEATFGKAGKDDPVLDPNYRKALKLDPAAFACSFQPADYGILNAIQKFMTTKNTCIRTELHKLNVYRAGDFFKAHVDTPRGANMFASLVVCLPSGHKGGNLVVRHGGRTSTFDWSTKSEDHIQWMALYSDCEHEVKEVLGGYRVTLTYNLYEDPLPGPENGPLVDLKSTVLYQTLVKALSVDSFMRNGGMLGLTLQHQYPHVSKTFVNAPDLMLKGADAVIFAVAEQLGLKTSFVHVYSGNKWNDEEGMKAVDSLQGLDVSDNYEDEGQFGLEHLRNNFRLSGDIKYSDVTWCIELDSLQEVGKVGLAYGNEPSLAVHYCVAALVIKVPEWGEERGEILSAAE